MKDNCAGPQHERYRPQISQELAVLIVYDRQLIAR